MKKLLVFLIIMLSLPALLESEALTESVIEKNRVLPSVDAPTHTNIPATSTATITPTATITATATAFAYYTDWASERFGVDWDVNCEDQDAWPWDGFRMPAYGLYFCVPGMISKDAWYFDTPADHFGTLSSYAPGVMEANLQHQGFNARENYGVALMSCKHIGESVWLRVPGEIDWQGPFIVVDCSQRNHLYYHMVGMNLAAEIDYRLAAEWDIFRAFRVDVHIGEDRPSDDWQGVSIGEWWVENALEFEGVPGTKAGEITR